MQVCTSPAARSPRSPREPGEAVAAHDQGVLDAAVAELGQHPGPELRALAGLDPDPQDVLHAVQVDADRDVRRAVRTALPSRIFTTSASR